MEWDEPYKVPVAEAAIVQAMPKLSALQKHVLRHLYQCRIKQAEYESRPGYLAGCKHLNTFGSKWRAGGTPAQRASLSRALARLEARGLLLRQNSYTGSEDGGCRTDKSQTPPKRTVEVLLTPLGVAVAKRLTSDAV